MWQVIYRKKSRKLLDRLPERQRYRIESAIEKLRENPFYRDDLDTKKLEASENWRLRVGDWRIIYYLYEKRLLIEIIEIGPRGDVYKGK